MVMPGVESLFMLKNKEPDALDLEAAEDCGLNW